MGELLPVVGLDDPGSIAEILDGPLEEIAGGVRALLLVGVEETLPGSFVDDRVLVELVRKRSDITGGRDVFDVHLPFHPDLGRRVVLLGLVGLLGRRGPGRIAEPAENPVKGAGVAGVALPGAKLAIKFAQGDVGIGAVVIADPFEFLFGMGVGMRRMRTMGAVQQGLLGAVEAFVPAHEGSLGDMVATANEADGVALAVKFDCVEFCGQFMWQITLGMCYSIVHGDRVLSWVFLW